jgi:hypothetical protein
MNAGTDAGATPASVLENMRPIEIARLVELVELVERVERIGPRVAMTSPSMQPRRPR